MNSPNRRQFLGTAAVSLVVLNSPVLADDDKKKKKKEPKPFDAGSLADDFKDDGIYDKHVREEKVFVRRFENRLTAFSAICTHKNCTLRKREKDIRCPCHGSLFDFDGYPTEGDAKISLERYGISIVEGRVIVDPTKVFPEKKWDDKEASVEIEKK
jgi:Rieske Fe-S protein